MVFIYLYILFVWQNYKNYRLVQNFLTPLLLWREQQHQRWDARSLVRINILIRGGALVVLAVDDVAALVAVCPTCDDILLKEWQILCLTAVIDQNCHILREDSGVDTLLDTSLKWQQTISCRHRATAVIGSLHSVVEVVLVASFEVEHSR